MPTTTELLEELARAAKTFNGGTMLLAENRNDLVSEMHEYLYTMRRAKHAGATPYEIQQAVAGSPVRHYLD